MNHSASFEPVFPAEKDAMVSPSGAIYVGNYDSLFGHGRSYHVGDVVTVVFDESTQANRTQNNNLSRAATNTALPATMTGFIPQLNGGTTTSKGAGEADQAASLNGSITVTVTKVMANGNLVLRGEKQMVLTEGTEILQVAGIARPDDISPNNSLQSHRLANAQITYRGTGDMANATSAGWGTSALLKWWPF
jgi:flagellar L-ring protein precursor FlgH